jgi:hypothetical protein
MEGEKRIVEKIVKEDLWAYSNEEQADVCVGDFGLRNMGVFI